MTNSATMFPRLGKHSSITIPCPLSAFIVGIDHTAAVQEFYLLTSEQRPTEKLTYGSRISPGETSQSANTSRGKLHENTRNLVDEIGMREICMQVSMLPRLDLFDRRGNVNKVEWLVLCSLLTASVPRPRNNGFQRFRSRHYL